MKKVLCFAIFFASLSVFAQKTEMGMSVGGQPQVFSRMSFSTSGSDSSKFSWAAGLQRIEGATVSFVRGNAASATLGLQYNFENGKVSIGPTFQVRNGHIGYGVGMYGRYESEGLFKLLIRIDSEIGTRFVYLNTKYGLGHKRFSAFIGFESLFQGPSMDLEYNLRQHIYVGVSYAQGQKGYMETKNNEILPVGGRGFAISLKTRF